MDGLRVLILGLGAAVAVASGRVKFPSNCSLSEDCKNLINDMIEVGETEKVQRLIECGADVNAHGGYEQRTPCHCAATAGHPALLEWMLATAGADPNPTNRKNNTPLAEVGRCRLNTPALKASAP